MNVTAYERLESWRPPDAKLNCMSPSVALNVSCSKMIVLEAKMIQEWDGDNGRYLLLIRVNSPTNSGTRSNTTGATWWHTSEMPLSEAMELVSMAKEKGIIRPHMPRYTPGVTEAAQILRDKVNSRYKPISESHSTCQSDEDYGEDLPLKGKKRKNKSVACEKNEKPHKARNKKPKYAPVASRNDILPGSELQRALKKREEVVARDADGDWYNARVFNITQIGDKTFASVHFFGWPKDYDITWNVDDGNIRLPPNTDAPEPPVSPQPPVSPPSRPPQPTGASGSKREREAQLESKPLWKDKKLKLVIRKNENAKWDLNVPSEDEFWTSDNDTDDEDVYDRRIVKVNA